MYNNSYKMLFIDVSLAFTDRMLTFVVNNTIHSIIIL